MKKRVPSLSLVAFDPTPEESRDAERAKPIKIPLCIRCKLRPRMTLVETVGKLHRDETGTCRLSVAFLHISKILLDPKTSASLSRADIERLKAAHAHLARASKGRYCASCFDIILSFSMATAAS